jgi:hypothetical protein
MQHRFNPPAREFDLVLGPADDAAPHDGAGGDDSQGTDTFIDGGGI